MPSFVYSSATHRVRALYDPRAFEKALAKRNEEAAESASQFREDLANGVLDPKSPGFNQGAFELAPKPPASDGKIHHLAVLLLLPLEASA